MLCAPLFMCTSGNTALLGHPRGLSIQLSTCSIQFSEFLPICLTRKWTKHKKYLKFAIFIRYKNGHQRLLGAQSIKSFFRKHPQGNRMPCTIFILLYFSLAPSRQFYRTFWDRKPLNILYYHSYISYNYSPLFETQPIFF